jgi:trk system potassium uptake protein TrkH
MFKTIIRQIAGLQIILGMIVFIPALIACIYREWYSCIGFCISGTLIAGIGVVIYKALKDTPEPGYRHALMISAAGWLMIIIVGALPYVLIAYITPVDVMQGFVPSDQVYTSSLMNFKNVLHAIFESTSAFTTTGLTMAYHEPSIGKALLFYRSLSQWVGGAGFIVMSLAIFNQLPGQGAMLLYGSEPGAEKLKSNVIDTAKAIWKVYLLVTAIMVLYLFVGTYLILPDYPLRENIFDAVNHAMAGQSTGVLVH